MNFNLNVFLLCPIPEEQKPINEYIELKKNMFLNWTSCSLKNYILKIVSGYLIVFPFFLFCFLQLTPFSFLEIVKIFCLSSIFFFISILIRWSSINKRLMESRVFYEETSWFDGQVWEKPFFLIKNDKLLSSQKIQPIVTRIWASLLIQFPICVLVLNL
jgi:hypothetical protein